MEKPSVCTDLSPVVVIGMTSTVSGLSAGEDMVVEEPTGLIDGVNSVESAAGLGVSGVTEKLLFARLWFTLVISRYSDDDMFRIRLRRCFGCVTGLAELDGAAEGPESETAAVVAVKSRTVDVEFDPDGSTAESFFF